jgi:hypothetical protein
MASQREIDATQLTVALSQGKNSPSLIKPTELPWRARLG